MSKTLNPTLFSTFIIIIFTIVLAGCGSKSDSSGGAASVSESSSAVIGEEIAELNQELNGSEVYQLSNEELEAMLAEGVITPEEANEIKLLLN